MPLMEYVGEGSPYHEAFRQRIPVSELWWRLLEPYEYKECPDHVKLNGDKSKAGEGESDQFFGHYTMTQYYHDHRPVYKNEDLAHPHAACSSPRGGEPLLLMGLHARGSRTRRCTSSCPRRTTTTGSSGPTFAGRRAGSSPAPQARLRVQKRRRGGRSSCKAGGATRTSPQTATRATRSTPPLSTAAGRGRSCSGGRSLASAATRTTRSGSPPHSRSARSTTTVARTRRAAWPT
ncbi:hypothetical protein EMIHUDRAFT_447089, partial [Emiliania huxleyi CCMP1516]|uniref:Uncharacterized protein n=2 Tax=Emiliania huxleyi TaxID=2903 RepID=A0A0D3KCR8_EMIH1